MGEGVQNVPNLYHAIYERPQIHKFTNQQNKYTYTFADINIAEYEYMRGKIFKYIGISKNSLITGVMGLKSGISRFYLPVQNNQYQDFLSDLGNSRFEQLF